ncbi:hypothetical protein HMPREF0972_02480 [Actinomyces sp. oral taxon 848 str. F0332]|nr:hypothetical protein HMPREF0972_02480 [Actinomyces sp. oral taxon 848 str. F0332]
MHVDGSGNPNLDPRRRYVTPRPRLSGGTSSLVGEVSLRRWLAMRGFACGGEGDRRRRRGSRRSERRQGARGTPVAAWGRDLLEDRRWRATRPVYLLGATRRFARRRRHVRVAVSAFPRGGRSFGARRGCAQAQSRRCGRCAAGVPHAGARCRPKAGGPDVGQAV